MTRVEFAVFHVDPAEGMGVHQDSGVAFDYHEMLSLAFRSAELFHPGCGLSLLTDERTPRWSGLPRRVGILRRPADERLMFARLEAEIDFFTDAPDADLLVSFDGDILINAPLDELAGDDWDVTLTYRDEDEFPINGGITVLNGRSRPAGLRYLAEVHRLYALDDAEGSEWWGHQRALIEALGREAFARRTEDVMVVDGVVIRLLPCELFNFSPAEDGRELREPLPTKRVLHFKGSRKQFMKPYWRARLAPLERPSVIRRAAARLAERQLRETGQR